MDKAMSRGRILEFDLARDIAILVLPLVHVQEYWGYECGGADILTLRTADALAAVSHFVCIFAAPVFMVCMGMNMVFTRKQSARDFARRGLAFLALEACLNIVRYLIPGVLGILLGGGGTDARAVTDYFIFGQGNSDILAFAGLCFLVFALFKKLSMSPKAIFAAAAGCSVLNQVLILTVSSRIDAAFQSNFFCNLLGNFIWVNGDSTFPLISWLIFPAAGCLFAACIDGRGEKDVIRAIRSVGLWACAVLAVMITVLSLLGEDAYVRINDTQIGNRMDIVCVVAELAASFAFLLLCSLLCAPFKKSEACSRAIMLFSRNITYFYCIQWILVGWVLFLTGGLHQWGSRHVGLGWSVACIVMITLISAFGGHYLYERIRRRKLKASL